MIHDMRYGLRTLRKDPGFTLASVLALALGIGANTAIFSVVSAVLLRPLPYADADRLVLISETSRTGEPMSVSWPNFVDWREQSRVFERIGCYRFDSFNLTGTDEPERLEGRSGTASYLPTLGVDPILGRHLLAEEDRLGAAPVVLLAEAIWSRRFASDPQILGKPVTLNGVPHTVVGVVPDRLARLQGTDVYVPLGPRLTGNFLERGAHNALTGVGLLRRGVTLRQAQAEMDTIAARLSGQYPDSNHGTRVEISLARERLVGGVRGPLLMLAGAVGFVLLIACANVANLTLSRAAAREGEMAIRSALGASRSRLTRQLLTESVLLSLAGGGVGLLLAVWGTEALGAAGAANVPRIDEVRIDGGVLVFTLGVSVLTGILFGLMPAFQSSRPDLAAPLKEGGRIHSSGRRGRLRDALVVSQVALALVLLAGAGLLARSLFGLSRVDPGFDAGGVLTVSLSAPHSKYPSLEQWTAFHGQVLERIQAVPGVQAVALASGIPLAGGGSESSFGVDGRLPAPGEAAPLGQYVNVSPDYFRTLGIPLVRGRSFTHRDGPEAPRVVIVDETLASRHFPGQDPVGQRVAFEGTREQPQWREVVGVVGHTRHYGLDAPSRAQLYVPFTQMAEAHRDNRPDMAFFVRATAQPDALGPSVRAAVWSLDGDQPIFLVQTLEQFVSDQTAQHRFTALLLGTFSGLALALAGVGIYAVMSYAVTTRTHEIGVRMALGARRGDVAGMVVRDALRLVMAGVALGLVASLGLTRLLSGMLFGVGSADPITFAGVCALLAAVALAAGYLPARRAASVDPMTALRYE